MSFQFSDDNLKQIEFLKTRYPSLDALSLPLLWMAQYQDGFISLEAIDEISKITKLPPMEIYRVATFYTMFKLQKQEKLLVSVCKTLSCKLCGSDEILDHLKSKDVEIEYVECLGSCGTSPVMQIKDVNYENLTPQKVDDILEELL
ncbi:NAD(P)H-dependent oxidoreductase subunit E [Sulfurimonas sp.]|uniref:NADH-quinone oxidoreductase subunit NuoE family protein n=1 Tax=Sulfurimonas sp. TaxID=2022749 RepID=UPI0035649DC8